jgi:multidrug efflux pump subunit AcrA (membrane-fusion protein)
MSDEEKPENLSERVYPEDKRLAAIEQDPDRRMTRAEWEHEDSLARQAAHKKHQQVQHDREVQQEFDKKKHSRHRNWKKILLWVGGGMLVLLLIFLAGFIPRHEREKKAAAESRDREKEAPEVDVIQVRRGKATGELTVPGTTASFTEAYLYARANGYLKKRFADIGDHVKKGQLLALIDAPDLDSQVDQAREQLNQAKAQLEQQQAQLNLNRVTWERWRTLVAKGVFSRQDGDQREADFLAQQALLASAQRNVDSYRANLQRMIALQGYERITAPFDGIVTQRNTDIGALVGASGAASTAPMQSPQSPSGGSASVASANTSGTTGMQSQGASPSTGEAQGGPIFTVAQIDTLRILVSVPEGYTQSVRKGMKAQVFLQERPNQPVAGMVARTADSLDQNTRTMLTEVDVPNHDGRLFPGMYAVITFDEVRGVPPLTVPGDAVVVRNDKTSVALVRNNQVRLMPVLLGRDYGPSVEILSGLKEGDWVVPTVTDEVRDGVKVRSHPQKGAAQNAGDNSNQADQAPDSGPNQYGDQSIVNSATESTTQRGKPGQKSNGKGSNGKQKQNGSDKKDGSQ